MSIIRVAALALALAAPALLPTTLTAAELKLDADLGQTVLSTAKPGSVFLRLNLKSLATAKSERRTPVNVAIVIDRSGSMQGDRIAAAKEGARVALKRLSSDDIVSLVSYNHDVDILTPAAPLRDSRDKLIEAIDSLQASGTTALYAGVQEGGRQVEKFVSDNNVNRVILLSDGLANVGPSTPGELAELGRKLASKGISVSTIGLGLDYNEDLMQRLAAASDGNHAFVERPSDLAEIFDREFGDALSVSARDITIIIECKLGFKPMRILGRDGSIAGDKVTLKLNQMQADNERYVVVELQAPEGRSEGAAEVADVTVTYVGPRQGRRAGPRRGQAQRALLGQREGRRGRHQQAGDEPGDAADRHREEREGGGAARQRRHRRGAQGAGGERRVHQALARRVHLGCRAGAAGLGQRAQRSRAAEPRSRQQARQRRLGPDAQDDALRPAQGQGAAGLLTDRRGHCAVAPGCIPAPLSLAGVRARP